MMAKNAKEAGGIWKADDPRCMVFAWSTGNDDRLTFMDITSPEDQIGRTRITNLSSPTCSTVHRRHGFEATPSGVMSLQL